MDVKGDLIKAGAVVTPPGAVTLWASLQEIRLNEVVAIATLVYIALQAAYLVWKWRREAKSGPKDSA